MGRGENRMGCGGIGVGFLYGMKDKGYRNNGCNLGRVIDGSSDFYERSIFPYSLFNNFIISCDSFIILVVSSSVDSCFS